MSLASRKLALVLALALALLWAGVGFVLFLERDRTLVQAKRDAGNLALAFEEQSFWILSTVDGLLHKARDAYDADPNHFDIGGFLNADMLPAGFEAQLSVIGPDGYMLQSSTPMGSEVRITNFLERPYVAAHVRDDTGRIFIGAPTISRPGSWVLPVSLRLNAPNGGYNGVLVMMVDPFYLSGYYQRLDIGSLGMVAIVGTDGIIRARSSRLDAPTSTKSLGRIITGDRVLESLRAFPAGAAEYSSPVDNIPRIMAFRHIRDYPLIAVVGLGVDEILQPWRASLWRTVMAAVVVSGGLVFLFMMLCRESARRQEQARDIAEANRLLRLAEQVAMIGHWRLELGTRRMTWSDEVYRIHGLSKADFTPTVDGVLNAYHPDDRPRLRELVVTAMKSGSSYEMSLRIVRPGGEIRHVVTRGVVEFGPDGRPLALFGAMSDVTDRTHQEEALQAARREAEAAARAKADFLATVSHELRTPLNAVIGFADLLLAADLPEAERRHYIRLQAEAGRTLLSVINDVLDFSKIDAGRLELEILPTDTVGVLQTCVELVRPMAQEKGLTLAVDLASDLPPWLLLDPTRVRQVVLNLLNNATKFTQAGKISLTARVIREGADDGLLRITVEDTGIGISPERLGRLFSPFHQADASTARRYGGTGLGLAICRRLVELMGGQIGVSSEPGRGSRFWVEIPMHPTVPPSNAPALPTPGASADAGRGRALHVLVAEDLPVNQLLVRAILERAGHRVDMVADGAAALQAVQAQSYDLVLMDVQMPGMDGLAATRAIRALPSVAGRIPIVALTANALASEVERCRQAGMNDHIAKPIEAEHLVAALARWAQRIDSAQRGDAADALAPGEGVGRPSRSASTVMSSDMQAQLQELMGSGALLTMMRELQSTLRNRVEQALSATAEPEAIRQQAHSMVSLSGNFGLLELSAVARELEQAIDNGAGRDGVTDLLTRLRQAAERAHMAVAGRIEQLSNASGDSAVA